MTRFQGVVLLALLAACGKGSTEFQWLTLGMEDLDAAQEQQYARALAAWSAMFEALMSRVSAEIATSGPAGTVGVCNEAAPQIAAAVAAEHGLRIGRTSWKLRNPANAAPDRAADLLEDRPEQERLTRGPEGHLGVTLPVHLSTKCLVCHGNREQLAPEVLEALAAHYPEDNATGFADGDLRGWFWVEVPPASE